MFTFILAQAVNFFAELITILVIVHVVLSYFMSPYHPIRETIDRLVEPLLAHIRRVMPLLGPFDFSPVVLIILVQLISGILVQLLLQLR